MKAEGGGLRITEVRVIDPFRGFDGVVDVTVSDGVFEEFSASSGTVLETMSGKGLWLVPRLTDMHVHFRSPGQEWKETLLSGSQAAAHGGFSVVATMPNTVPVADMASLVQWQRSEGQRLGYVEIMPIGAVTKGSQGKELAELWEMEQAGAVAFSDDGRAVADGALIRAALSYSRTLRHPVIQHAEDLALTAGGVMHEGAVSGRLGLAGAPAEAESSMVWRDVQLAALTGGRLHVAHVSSVGALEALEWASRHHLAVSAEVTPHHLFFTDERVAKPAYDTTSKVNPPLRSENHRRALMKALADGLISVVASDHAPHHADEKDRPYAEAPFGISGLETAISAMLTLTLNELVMEPLQLFERMTRAPHRVLGLSYAGVAPGSAADFALIDPATRYRVDAGRWYSAGKNTPWDGMELTGRVVATMHHGRWVMRDGEVLKCEQI